MYAQKFESKHRLGHLNQFGEIEWENNRLEKWMALPAFEEKCSACVLCHYVWVGAENYRLYSAQWVMIAWLLLRDLIKKCNIMTIQ